MDTALKKRPWLTLCPAGPHGEKEGNDTGKPGIVDWRAQANHGPSSPRSETAGPPSTPSPNPYFPRVTYPREVLSPSARHILAAFFRRKTLDNAHLPHYKPLYDKLLTAKSRTTFLPCAPHGTATSRLPGRRNRSSPPRPRQGRHPVTSGSNTSWGSPSFHPL